MIGLGLSIAMLISAIMCAKDPNANQIFVAAQLIASGLFYIGFQVGLFGQRFKEFCDKDSEIKKKWLEIVELIFRKEKSDEFE